MLRTSDYTIYVDLLSDDQVLLVHGYTGAYDLVLNGIANFIKSLSINKTKRKNERSISIPSAKTMDILKRRGYLTNMSIDEEQEYFLKIVGVLHKKEISRVPSFMIIPTYDCNLRCPYCYQSHMRVEPKNKYSIKDITKEIIEYIFIAMDELEKRHLPENKNDNNCREIGFYGGEPLIKRNKSIIEHIIIKAHSRYSDTTFWAVTNGTDLKYYEDLLGPNQISSLQITLDGSPHEHNKMRIYPNGDGSFERIASNITLALDKDVSVRIRVNVNRNNITSLPILAREIFRRKWDQYTNFSAYSTPIDAVNSVTRPEQVFSTGQLEQGLLALRDNNPEMRIIDFPDIDLMSQVRSIFINKTFPDFRSSYCKAQKGMYLFDPRGDIYSCWEYAGDKHFRVGHISSNGEIMLSPLLEKWQNRTIATNPQCIKCPYALYCGGGCVVKASRIAGTNDSGYEINGNFCDGFATRFKQSVVRAYMEYQKDDLPRSNQQGLCIS